MRTVGPILIVVVLAAALAAQGPRVTLAGLALLPADTFAEGPPSGAWRREDGRGVAQFPSQPVQGVSALWPAGADEWWALSDNGFGTKLNSPDYLLRIYRLRLHWGDGARAGTVSLGGFVQLADPDRKLPFRVAREFTPQRWLTGADLDPESLVRMDDGTFWIGDEFGPFLVHVAADGRVLSAPYEVPGLRGPDHPAVAPPDAGQPSAATARRSRGFEGLAYDGTRLYPVIEAGIGSDEDAALIFEFDVPSRTFTGQTWRLALSSAEHAITEFVAIAPAARECAARFLAIERDSLHGSAARLKRVLEVHLAGNTVVSHVVADLLDISNPLGVAGHPPRFTFPFITPEALWPLTRTRLVLANDNNYPAGGGRAGAERDATEFIRLDLARPLCSA